MIKQAFPYWESIMRLQNSLCIKQFYLCMNSKRSSYPPQSTNFHAAFLERLKTNDLHQTAYPDFSQRMCHKKRANMFIFECRRISLSVKERRKKYFHFRWKAFMILYLRWWKAKSTLLLRYQRNADKRNLLQDDATFAKLNSSSNKLFSDAIKGFNFIMK